MVGPHQDNGVPWTPTTTPIQNQSPVANTGGGWSPGAGRDESGYLPTHPSVDPSQPIDTIGDGTTPVVPEPVEYFGELTNTGLGFEDQGQYDYSTGVYRDPYTGKITKITPSSELDTHSKMLQLMETAADPSGYDTASGLTWGAAEKQALADKYKGLTTQNLFGMQGTGTDKQAIFTTPRIDEFGQELGGVPIMSSQGRALHDWIESQGGDYNLSDALHVAPEILRSQNIYGGYGGGGYDYGRDLLGERRAWQEGLWYGPKVAQQRPMEEQGFFNTLGSKIRNPFLEAVGETLAINPEGRSGLYGKTMFHPQMRKPWGLEKEYATGVRSPLYQNRARGGIMSVWADRR